jgi:hypothetical protein
MAYNTGAYVWEAGGFGELQNHIADIQASGLTTVILNMLYIGRPMETFPKMKVGDLMYNNCAPDLLLVSEGKFNPNNSAKIAAWPAQLAQPKQQGSVSKVFISVGGDSRFVYDFRTIQCMFSLDISDMLNANIKGLKGLHDRRGLRNHLSSGAMFVCGAYWAPYKNPTLTTCTNPLFFNLNRNKIISLLNINGLEFVPPMPNPV